MTLQTNAVPALEVYADYAATLELGDIPQRVRDKVKTSLIDLLWGCLHVHHDSRAKATLKAMHLDGPQARASILTTGHRATAAEAAFVNATASAATDRSDTHLSTATHPGIIVIPSVLAVAEERDLAGEDIERGIIVGYEIMGRIARSVQSPAFSAIHRPTAVAAPVAAAIAVATALRLDRKAIVSAGSLAAQTAIGFNEWARSGTGEHVFHAGVAARNAVTSVYIAEGGVETATTALDGPSGLLAGYGALEKVGALTAELGKRYEMDEIAFKPAPACFFAQTPVQTACLVQPKIDTNRIEKIEIFVTSTADAYPGCSAATGIDSVQAAVMSIPFAVASTLRAGGLDDTAWSNFRNPATLALAARCIVVPDPALSAAYPKQSGTRIVIQLLDGKSIEVESPDFISMDDASVRARFRRDARHWLDSDAVTAILAAVDRLDQLANASDLTYSGLSRPTVASHLESHIP